MNTNEKRSEALAKYQKCNNTFREAKAAYDAASSDLSIAAAELARVLNITMGGRAEHGVVSNRTRYFVKGDALCTEQIKFDIL